MFENFLVISCSYFFFLLRQNLHVAKAGLELIPLPLVSQVLRLQAHATIPGFELHFSPTLCLKDYDLVLPRPCASRD